MAVIVACWLPEAKYCAFLGPAGPGGLNFLGPAWPWGLKCRIPPGWCQLKVSALSAALGGSMTFVSPVVSPRDFPVKDEEREGDVSSEGGQE